jgi:recombinational DNA repair protein (RecF pathway)
MHTIYHTEAIIIRSEPAGEANKRVWLFTQELGLIIATVQGVRKPSAKLQSHITDYTLVSADLIKGKNNWRLISAAFMDSAIGGSTRAPLARAYVRTLNFLERFLIGEGTHPELFNHIVELAEIVKSNNGQARLNGAVGQARFLDALSLWKMLALLGYISVEPQDAPLFNLSLRDAAAQLTDAKVTSLVKSATESISHSHL